MALELFAEPLDSRRAVARALVPIGNFRRPPWFVGDRILQLVHHHRRAAADEEEHVEARFSEPWHLVGKRTVGVLALEDFVGALLVPVVRADVFAAAGQSHAL